MATLTPTLTLASTDVSTAEALSVSVTDTLAIAGGAVQFQVVTSTTGTVFAAAANYTKSYVFLQNLDSSIAMTIEKADGGDEYFNPTNMQSESMAVIMEKLAELELEIKENEA